MLGRVGLCRFGVIRKTPEDRKVWWFRVIRVKTLDGRETGWFGVNQAKLPGRRTGLIRLDLESPV